MEYLNYAQHYFDKDMAISFFLVSLAGLVIVMGIIFMTARIWQEIDPEEIPEEEDSEELPEAEVREAIYDYDEGDSDDFYDEEDSEVKTNRRNLACINRSISRVSESDINIGIDQRQNGNQVISQDGNRNRSRNMDRVSENTSRSRSLSRSRGRNISRNRGINQRRRLIGRRTPDFRYRRPLEFIESFYELVFASTSILLLLSLYYIIGDRINVDSINAMWNDYKDWLLLLFLILSMLLNRILDRILVPMRHIDAKQRASMRLVSSIYVVFILLYIRFIYESYNYESLIIYFVMLVVGRLFYFDVTWEGFKSDITGIVKNFPFVILMGAYTAGVTWYGFHSGFLLKANGVLVSTLIAHLFMDVCIVLFDKSRIWKLFLR